MELTAATAPYTLVLTHDVDELEWRGMGLLGRPALALARAASLGAASRLLTGRASFADFLRCLGLLFRLPLIIAGIVKDPLRASIDRITRLERAYGARSTFFLMPFAHRAGRRADMGPAPRWRASRYRLSDHAGLIRALVARGWEAGVHGIDCHVSVEAARAERAELQTVVGPDVPVGVRMHWLYRSPALEFNLAEAGFAYDSTLGSNSFIGFPSLPDGTRALRPFADAETGLPVVPLVIQDVALLRADHMNLKPGDAWQAIETVLKEARRHRAVVTVLWHNDSFLAPRCWGGIYRRLLERASADGAQILSAGEAAKSLTPARRASRRRTGAGERQCAGVET